MIMFKRMAMSQQQPQLHASLPLHQQLQQQQLQHLQLQQLQLQQQLPLQQQLLLQLQHVQRLQQQLSPYNLYSVEIPNLVSTIPQNNSCAEVLSPQNKIKKGGLPKKDLREEATRKIDFKNSEDKDKTFRLRVPTKPYDLEELATSDQKISDRKTAIKHLLERGAEGLKRGDCIGALKYDTVSSFDSLVKFFTGKKFETQTGITAFLPPGKNFSCSYFIFQTIKNGKKNHIGFARIPGKEVWDIIESDYFMENYGEVIDPKTKEPYTKVTFKTQAEAAGIYTNCF